MEFVSTIFNFSTVIVFHMQFGRTIIFDFFEGLYFSEFVPKVRTYMVVILTEPR